MPLLLIFLAFTLAAAVALAYFGENAAKSWRQCFLTAALGTGLLIVAGTEILSLYGLLTRGWLGAYWLAVCFSLILAGYARRRELREKLCGLSFSGFSRAECLLVSCVALIALATGFLALLVPPNNWDSMSYHMARVTHWQQNASVAFYPTNITRQLHRAPFAEYAILHFQLLWGGDRFANVVQWLAMLGSLLTVTLITLRFGAGRKIQLAAAALAVTLPLGILEASTTQNDYVCAFWLLCFVYLLGELNRTAAFFSYFLAGTALGLAVLTKATACVFAAPFALWFLAARVRERDFSALKKTVLALAVALALNAPHCARNIKLYGAPLGPRPHADSWHVETNEMHGLKPFLSNIARQLSLELVTPSPAANSFVERAVRSIHGGLGINPDDPATTVSHKGYFLLPFRAFEDSASNPMHFLVFAWVLLSFSLWRSSPALAAYSAQAVLGFALFCFLVKWSPWSTRHHLAVFLLLSPVVAVRLGESRGFKHILIVLALASSYWLVCNVQKPVLAERNIFNMSRLEQYFIGRDGNREAYVSIARAVDARGCRDIGLVLGPDTWEYPFWILLNPYGGRRLEHLEVGNPSSNIAMPEFNPCFVVRSNMAQP